MKWIDEPEQIEGKDKERSQASKGRMRRYTGGKIMFLLSIIVIFFGLLLLPSSVVDGSSFFQDVVKTKKSSSTQQQQILNDKLLSKAVPLADYRKRMSNRRLDYDYYYNYRNDDSDDKAQDDYYVNEEDYLNFDGYSLKYAKCQPVQRFSQSALEAGEYSPMVINDIVIMRLCPSQYCSSNREYGCSSNFVEYAIELTDYIRIMLRYKIDKKEQLCDWCDSCSSNNRQRRTSSDYYYYTDENGNFKRGERKDDDDANNGGDDYTATASCDDYDTYCSNEYGYSICNDDDNDGGNNGGGDDDYNDNDDNSNSMTPDEYLEIIDCVQLDGGYFIRPRCDAYTETLSMGIYYDRFCSSYAGNEVNIANFDLGIDQSYFQEFGENAGCLDCSESSLPPYLNSNANLCNRIDVESSRCTYRTTFDMFVSNDTDSTSDQTDCSFIQSVRSGTYDNDGQFFVNSVFGNIRMVTDTQKALLGMSLAICALLAFYSCYLHHAITNLLIKSLSHTDLLPPSKFQRRRSNGSGNRRRGRRGRKLPVNEDADEDEEENLEVKLADDENQIART